MVIAISPETTSLNEENVAVTFAVVVPVAVGVPVIVPVAESKVSPSGKPVTVSPVSSPGWEVVTGNENASPQYPEAVDALVNKSLTRTEAMGA